VLDSEEWWNPDFWSSNTPTDHFDTPSTLCAQALSGAILHWCRKLGLQRVIDVGSGDGKLLDECSARAHGLQFSGIDVRKFPPSGGWRGITARWDRRTDAWVGEELRIGPEPCLVIAVEWLDDLPAAVAMSDPRSAPAETGPVRMGPDGDSAPLSSAENAWLARWWPHLPPGERAVVGLTRDRAWCWWARRLPPGSVLATIDYGHTIHDRPADGGLAAHVHGVAATPGTGTNVTASVAIDSLTHAVEELGAERLWCGRLMDLPAGFWPRSGSALRRLALRSQEALLRAPERFGNFWLVAHRIAERP